MDLELRGKRAIVTGGSRGIGLATARALSREGCAVVLVARGEEALEAAARSIEEAGGRAVAIVADSRDDAEVRAAVDRTVSSLGGVDILINGAATPAGGNTPAPTWDVIQDDDVRQEMETKVLGYLRFARAVAPHLVEQGWGRIINISGLAARRANSIAGSMRNVSVSAMTKNLADQLGPHGVNVTVVHPGTTETERTAGLLEQMMQREDVTEEEARRRMAAGITIGRMITAEEIADVICFLASPRSVPINGDAIVAGGGFVGAIYY